MWVNPDNMNRENKDCFDDYEKLMFLMNVLREKFACVNETNKISVGAPVKEISILDALFKLYKEAEQRAIVENWDEEDVLFNKIENFVSNFQQCFDFKRFGDITGQWLSLPLRKNNKENKENNNG